MEWTKQKGYSVYYWLFFSCLVRSKEEIYPNIDFDSAFCAIACILHLACAPCVSEQASRFLFSVTSALSLGVCCNYVLYHDITFSQPQSRKHDFFYTLGVDLMMSVPEGLHFCDSGHNEWPFVLFFSLRNELGPLNRVKSERGLSMQDKWRYLSE